MSTDEQRHELYLKQKALLDTFLEKKAITQAQYDKSLQDLTEKMGEKRVRDIEMTEVTKGE